MSTFTPASQAVMRAYVASAGDTLTFMGTTYTPVLASTLQVSYYPFTLNGSLLYVMQIASAAGQLFKTTYPSGGLLDGNIYWDVVS